jgi:hypothetical protein
MIGSLHGKFRPEQIRRRDFWECQIGKAGDVFRRVFGIKVTHFALDFFSPAYSSGSLVLLKLPRGLS